MIDIIKVICRLPDVTNIAINYTNYPTLIRDLISFNIIDVEENTIIVFGRNIFVLNDIQVDHFRVNLNNCKINDELKWSNDIDILQVEYIDRILKLQALI